MWGRQRERWSQLHAFWVGKFEFEVGTSRSGTSAGFLKSRRSPFRSLDSGIVRSTHAEQNGLQIHCESWQMTQSRPHFGRCDRISLCANWLLLLQCAMYTQGLCIVAHPYKWLTIIDKHGNSTASSMSVWASVALIHACGDLWSINWETRQVADDVQSKVTGSGSLTGYSFLASSWDNSTHEMTAAMEE